MSIELLHRIPKLVGHRILCVGDLMLDKFIYGSVDRISPEAPVPVLREQNKALTLGGGGNVVRNIISLGGEVDMVGIIGQDQAGYDFSAQLAQLDKVSSYVICDNARPTTVKTRFIANGQQILRVDNETSLPVSADIETQIISCLKSAISSCKAIVLSDYAKGVLTADVIKTAITEAQKLGKPLLVDPKGRDFSRYRGAYILTPNRKELSEATGTTIKTVADAEEAARQLISKYDLGGVLAKLGGDGVCLVLRDMPATHVRASVREVYDVSGAGDTVVATMALALAGELTPQEGATLANVAGNIVVGKIGTAAVTLNEMSHALQQDESQTAERKIITLPEAAEQAERWRKQGLKVGFTNGVFDLLHPGHISLIKQARKSCDKLIVGLNSDASVKRLKGNDRPVQSEMARSIVLASLQDVDAVVIFTEDTPLESIKLIRPALLVKGADYKADEVVGASLVKEWGGEILLAQLIQGQSTSSTIAKLRA